MDLLSGTFLGNSGQTWALAFGVALGSFLVLRFMSGWLARLLTRVASRTNVYWDDVIAVSMTATKSTLIVPVAVFFGSQLLELPDPWTSALRSIAIIALVIQAGFWSSQALSSWLAHRSEEKADVDPSELMTLNMIGIGLRLALWSMVVLLALENVGVDVTALIAGLGIGGVAVALAAQNILGDLFASISIAFDKPFLIGDFVTVGDFMGNVEAIGVKTTRVRSLSGEQVVFSNTDLLDSRIRNYGRMYQRRVVLQIGVTYQTPREALRAIPGIIREAIEARPEDQVRFDRSHLASYGDFAITFESVYFVLAPEYALHMDIKQDVYLRIHEAFDERGIEFAYPTQTLFVERGEGS
ncbi:MAG: mechanosensitive ion channel family protein [Gemmatimonadota bacterium]|nr:mechanosensitive ion channel family protein [Gemmatimonadota bacterium]